MRLNQATQHVCRFLFLALRRSEPGAKGSEQARLLGRRLIAVRLQNRAERRRVLRSRHEKTEGIAAAILRGAAGAEPDGEAGGKNQVLYPHDVMPIAE